MVKKRREAGTSTLKYTQNGLKYSHQLEYYDDKIVKWRNWVKIEIKAKC